MKEYKLQILKLYDAILENAHSALGIENSNMVMYQTASHFISGSIEDELGFKLVTRVASYQIYIEGLFRDKTHLLELLIALFREDVCLSRDNNFDVSITYHLNDEDSYDVEINIEDIEDPLYVRDGSAVCYGEKAYDLCYTPADVAVEYCIHDVGGDVD